MTRSQCPLCLHDDKDTLLSLKYESVVLRHFLETYYKGRANLTLLSNGNYTIDHCKKCNMLWQREILDEEGMQQLYDLWIDPARSKKKRTSTVLTLQYAKHCARLLALFPHPEEALLLDYGAGWGEWCRMAQSFGFRTYAVELSRKRIEEISKKGIHAFLPSKLPTEKYDFIYLEQVLEHVNDPRALMEKLVGLLKDSGYFHIGVPNGKSVVRAAGNPTALLCKGPAQPLEHINIFTRYSLVQFMSSLGCRPVKQDEVLLRCRTIGQFFYDLLLASCRALPASVFPPGTSILFQKLGHPESTSS